MTVLEDEHGEPQALPAVEIVPDGGVYSYDARYTAGATEFFAPGAAAPRRRAAAAAAALTAYRVLGHRHLSRMDLIIDADGTPWFLEGNISPGMTETSLVPLALEAAGLDPTAVYARPGRARPVEHLSTKPAHGLDLLRVRPRAGPRVERRRRVQAVQRPAAPTLARSVARPAPGDPGGRRCG